MTQPIPTQSYFERPNSPSFHQTQTGVFCCYCNRGVTTLDIKSTRREHETSHLSRVVHFSLICLDRFVCSWTRSRIYPGHRCRSATVSYSWCQGYGAQPRNWFASGNVDGQRRLVCAAQSGGWRLHSHRRGKRIQEGHCPE